MSRQHSSNPAVMVGCLVLAALAAVFVVAVVVLT